MLAAQWLGRPMAKLLAAVSVASLQLPDPVLTPQIQAISYRRPDRNDKQYPTSRCRHRAHAAWRQLGALSPSADVCRPRPRRISTTCAYGRPRRLPPAMADKSKAAARDRSAARSTPATTSSTSSDCRRILPSPNLQSGCSQPATTPAATAAVTGHQLPGGVRRAERFTLWEPS